MRIRWLGDTALLFEWPDSDDGGERPGPSEIAARAARIRGLQLAGVRECVPAYRSVAVHLDLEALTVRGDGVIALEEAVKRLTERIRCLLDVGESARTSAAGSAERPEDEKARTVRLPVIYGGEDGPDLIACAERSGLTPEEFAAAHASELYEVAMIGFAPGFPYMTGLPQTLAQPRRDAPRLQVPPGAVGIAGVQTGVYPVRSPGGWQWIGRTPVPLFRPEADEPFLLRPGDRVQFVPVPAGADSTLQTIVTDAWSEDRVRVRPLTRMSEAEREGDGSDALEVRKPGMLTTVQDKGRHGWQSFGVSVGGAMDAESLRAANLLVGNPADAAALEMTAIGGEFRVMRGILAAVCGADLDARIDGEAMPLRRPVWLRAGVVVSFGKAKRGCRAYLAIAGGVATPLVLGSRSADMRLGLEGVGGRAFVSGDRVPAGMPSSLGRRIAASLRADAERLDRSWAAVRWSAEEDDRHVRPYGRPVEIRMLPGAQWEAFDAASRSRLLQERYRITADSDRMGLRLSGPRLMRSGDGELASHGLVPGTIQVPAGGLPILLAAGCQPTGGYPVVAHVIGADLPLLGQCMPGTELTFRMVELAEAWQARQRAERQYRLQAAGVQLAAKGQSS